MISSRLSAEAASLDLVVVPPEVPVSAQHAEAPVRPAMPKRELGEIVHAIEALSEADVVAEFEGDLTEAAHLASRGDSEAVERLVDRWWGWARLWTIDPADARRTWDGVDRVRREGLDDYQQAQIDAKRAAR